MSEVSLTIRKKRRFGDYLIKWEGELSDPSKVVEVIEENLPRMIEEDSPSIWIRLSGKDLSHITYFMDHGFKMHRIKNGETLVLNRWLRQSSYNLPPCPYSYIGVGAMCFNEEGKILGVRENFKYGPGPWKIPGGLFDPKVDKKFSDAAIRECFEETGIKAKFEYVGAQRLTLNSALFHQTDIYVVCRLSPITTEIKFDPIEIADCQWITVDELLEKCNPIAKQFLIPALNNKNGDLETQYPANASTIYHSKLE
ncbi:hydrolase, NUDIX family protein [Tritrichomonas foetus]|uniref:Hydrolase, NUDIX family protein n=1 Tax=Tritrichomonas foetus TaxID=1144522 RepID=A0A1J4KUB8_9EUKA|nr:hydrolase, NUDIX family protein [Tritrichomonas foetus]|eukprot:OHT13356.1 hydrolase, NUDIX family protein [Tritrichomonas foetus]